MPFGMEEAEIELKVAEELRKRPGHVAHFKKGQIKVLAGAIASIIVENNAKIQYSLSEAGVDLK